ncbi:putative ribonuclease H-like domain-containing protein [Tanacetum coccineum]|uniref:Ribonuclease H-like domain-containing protein n=1 Tax=Tanacetum coccineum TaxID=301880 RepID=A0ABQ5E563_9ASTR
MVPKALLMRSGLVSLTTARPVNTAQPKTIINSARPMTNLFNKAHSTVRRPINNKTETKNNIFNKRVNNISGKNVNTVRPKAVVNTVRPKVVLNAIKGNQVNAVKASACWGNPQMDLQDQSVIDSRCSRHMTGNMSYLTDFEEINKEYVAFGGNPKGGKITVRVPRKKNMYSVDLKNIIPKGGLTCLFAKVTSDESKLWHRRLGHINLKNMNKLVKENLVRGLPSKHFENDQTCVACQKGKQHRASYDYSRFSWVFFLATKDETSDILKSFITGVENLIDQRVKTADPLFSQNSKSSPDARFKPSSNGEKKVGGDPSKEDEKDDQEKGDSVNSTNNVNTASDGNNTNNVNVVSSTVNAAGIEVNDVGTKTSIELPNDPNMHELEDIVYLDHDKDVGAEDDINNLDAFMPVSPIPTTRVHKDHPVEQFIGDLNSAPQTRRMIKNLEEHGNPCIERSKLDKGYAERASTIQVTRSLDLGCIQEEGIDYDEVFASVARIEAIRLFLAYASFKDFVVYQMDVKSAFLYGKIEEDVYVCQPSGFEDTDFLDRVYKVEKALYRLHQALRAWYETLLTYLLDNGFQRGKIDKNLFIRRDKGELTFFLGLQIASTPMETQKPLLKDKDCEEVDVHLYRLMIGSLMYLTSSRHDIMFAVCQPKLGLWYPKGLPFDLVAYTDSDYAGASLDMKSTTGGCQFLGCRLISWQCKKQTVVTNSIIEAEYVAALSCCGQVLWIQNQLLDYGYNFMHTKIYIDNESTICIVKNSIFNSKTKHIEIRHHFIKNSNEKKLIQMIKIHTDKNVADFLTKAFDKGIGVNAGDSKLMLLGINLLLLGKINAASLDRKKIVVTKASIRRDLQLEDANGVDCLPNATFFEQLTLIGYEKLSQKLTFCKEFFSPQWKFLIHTILQCLNAKTTAWNEFSSTIASAIICLATNQKFNFSKCIFKSMMKNLDNAVKFLMYPRFILVFLNNQLEGMATHNKIFVAPSHTKKIFANMRRRGNDFSERETPLFPTMMKQKSRRRPKQKDTEIPQSSVPSDLTNITDEAVIEEPIEEITSLKKRVKRLENKVRLRTYKLKILYTIGRSARVVSFNEASLGDQEDASKQGRKTDDIDAGAKITLVDENQGRHDDDLIFDKGVLNDEEVFVGQDMAEKEVSTTVLITTAGEVVTTANIEVSTISPTAATITNFELTLA